jgi:hypothetical protein
MTNNTESHAGLQIQKKPRFTLDTCNAYNTGLYSQEHLPKLQTDM